MAPKPVDKSKDKERQKVVEDKTFGLKNKNKSKQVQKYIQNIQNSSKQVAGRPVKQDEEFEKRKERKEVQKLAALNAMLLGMGDLDKKGKKKEAEQTRLIDLYTDQREQNNKQEEEDMTDWDQAKLEAVIKTKHGAQSVNQTEIVCKFFLEAVEKSLYGWFWICPSGGDKCKYRHALPPGFVLKKKAKADDDADEKEETPLEELIEIERASLPPGGTPVTLETLTAWKKRKEDERLRNLEEARQKEVKKGAKPDLRLLSGKDLFAFDPSLFVDDEGAASGDDYVVNEEYQDVEKDGSPRSGEDEALFLEEDDLPEDLDSFPAIRVNG